MVAGLIIILLIIARGLISPDKEAPITQDQIKIQKGDDVVIINRNGLIEYRTKDEVFYKTWESGKVSAFFTSMEEKVRKYLEDPSAGGGAGCYQVTLYLDGELVSVCISDNDQVLEEVFDGFDEDLDDISLGDYFNDDDENGSGNGNSGSPTPTTTSAPSDPNATPTPTSAPGGDNGGGDPEENYPPVEAGCEYWNQQVVGDRAVISNTLCTIEEE